MIYNNYVWYIYVLRSFKDRKLYIRVTSDLNKRISSHNNGHVKSTKARKPFILVGYKKVKYQNEARWIEYQVKHHSDKKRKFLNSLDVIIDK